MPSVLHESPVVLTDALFIGRGANKSVYIDPEDASRCIKVAHRADSLDLPREFRYRKSRERRGLASTLLTAYYGPVATTRGPGHRFERVVDFDGAPSRPLEAFLREASAPSSAGGRLTYANGSSARCSRIFATRF